MPIEKYEPHDLSRKLWGLTFRTPLVNAAGMFKNGECYEQAYAQGAGAFLGGTSTWNYREGNTKEGIYLPFVPYPRSCAASNFLGLPNNGDQAHFKKLCGLARCSDFPFGWSIMASPDFNPDKQLKKLVEAMTLYEKIGIDFLEINESCPNTTHSDKGLEKRLQYIHDNFLQQRSRKIPVVVKFSIDTSKEKIPQLLDLLFDLRYDGVNFGNTSKDYTAMREKIHPKERWLFDYFTQNFGGGVSGRPLKEKSLELAATAVEYIKKALPLQEFHVIRTGGINSIQDIHDSDRVGISLNQWFTGYFEHFAKHGHDAYRNFFSM
ncbi:MAG: hypothetical protein AABX16_01590 [Nanoarchaeota archaeon]